MDADDIGDLAVAALTEEGHTGRLYELTGPRLRTFAEAVSEIARVTRRDIRYAEVSADEYAADLARANVPPDLARLVSYLFTSVLDGRNACIASGMSRTLRRQPRDFSEYVRHTAATGVWHAPPGTATQPGMPRE